MAQMVAIFAIFYFLLIRPQRKEQQRHRDMLEELKKGDEVITNGGIIGIMPVSSNTVPTQVALDPDIGG